MKFNLSTNYTFNGPVGKILTNATVEKFHPTEPKFEAKISFTLNGNGLVMVDKGELKENYFVD